MRGPLHARRIRLPVAVVLLLTPVMAVPQSLGDAAKQQAARRRTARTATKAYTEADLPQHEAAEGVAPSGSSTPAASAPSERAAEAAVRAELNREAAERSRKEQFWRQLISAARERIATARREHDVVCGPNLLVLSGG